MVDDVFGSEGVEHSHDPSGEFEVGGAAVRDENACMGALLAQGFCVKEFEVATIVGENRSLVRGRKLQLRGIGAT